MSVKVHFLIQIYTRADKIAVPLQMLCAWSAHCFVCPTNYQLPWPTWPGFLFTPPYISSKNAAVTQEKAILSVSWISIAGLLCFSDFFVGTHKMGLCILYENFTIHQLQKCLCHVHFSTCSLVHQLSFCLSLTVSQALTRPFSAGYYYCLYLVLLLAKSQNFVLMSSVLHK